MSWLRRRRTSPEDAFAEQIAALARSELGAEVAVRPGFSLHLRLPDGTDATLNLGTIFREAQELGTAERDDFLRRTLLGMAPSRPRTWEDAAPRLLPAVRAVSWAAALDPDSWRRPLAPFVTLLCAIDSEHSISFVTESDLRAWGVDGDEASRRAAANLGEHAVEVAAGPGVALIEGPDGYASSWLVVPSLVGRVAARMGGEVVAVAVERDALLLVDVADHAVAVERLGEAIDRYLQAPRQLSPVPYVVGEGVVRPWQPPSGHPAAPLVDRARHLLANQEYGAQRHALEELHQAAGEDVYVAPVTTLERPDGTLWSWTVWARDVTDGLLPRADVVVLGDGTPDGPIIEARWDDVQRLAGHALEATGYDPPRWRHRGWPDEATLAALREASEQRPFHA